MSHSSDATHWEALTVVMFKDRWSELIAHGDSRVRVWFALDVI